MSSEFQDNIEGNSLEIPESKSEVISDINLQYGLSDEKTDIESEPNNGLSIKDTDQHTSVIENRTNLNSNKSEESDNNPESTHDSETTETASESDSFSIHENEQSTSTPKSRPNPNPTFETGENSKITEFYIDTAEHSGSFSARGAEQSTLTTRNIVDPNSNKNEQSSTSTEIIDYCPYQHIGLLIEIRQPQSTYEASSTIDLEQHSEADQVVSNQPEVDQQHVVFEPTPQLNNIALNFSNSPLNTFFYYMGTAITVGGYPINKLINACTLMLCIACIGMIYIVYLLSRPDAQTQDDDADNSTDTITNEDQM